MSRLVRYVWDIETDNLLDDVSVVHCGVVYDLDTDEIWEFTPENIHELPKRLANADWLIGHNIIAYDMKVMEKLYPDEYLDYLQPFEGTHGERLFDTMVLSRTVWPDIKSMDYENVAKGALKLPQEASARKKLFGAHTLRAWGYRLGYYKGNAEGEVDFKTYTPQMLEYCKRDVLLNVKLWQAIESKIPELATGDVPYYVWLEHQFYRYLEYQQSFGVQFDVDFAQEICRHWEKELAKRLHEMKKLVPDIVVQETIIPKVNNAKLGYQKGVPFTKTKVTPFNPRSGPHVVHFLTTKYNWEPTQFTKPTSRHPKGQPEVTYDVLKHLPYKEAPLLARIKLLMDRLKLVKKSQGGSAWLQCVKPDGRIYGGIIHNGTPTARCRHLAPNLGNIPSAEGGVVSKGKYIPPKAIWGKALRKLFRAADGYRLVGIDFDGLEMRCLSEALWPYDNGKFYEMAFFGKKEDGTDAHSLNRDAVKRELLAGGFTMVAEHFTRDRGKTGFYAALYGAWPRKLGEVACDGLNIPTKMHIPIGKCVDKGLKENLKGIEQLIAKLEADYEACLRDRKWPHITGLDGRKIPVRKKGALLNTLLQSMGAILSKTACVLLLHRLKDNPRFGLPGPIWRMVLHVHDETEDEIKDEGSLISEFIDVATECFAEAGRVYNFRVPILGTAHTGSNWAETH